MFQNQLYSGGWPTSDPLYHFATLRFLLVAEIALNSRVQAYVGTGPVSKQNRYYLSTGYCGVAACSI